MNRQEGSLAHSWLGRLTCWSGPHTEDHSFQGSSPRGCWAPLSPDELLALPTRNRQQVLTADGKQSRESSGCSWDPWGVCRAPTPEPHPRRVQSELFGVGPVMGGLKDTAGEQTAWGSCGCLSRVPPTVWLKQKCLPFWRPRVQIKVGLSGVVPPPNIPQK